MEIISVENLKKSFHLPDIFSSFRKPIEVLKGITFQVEEGKVTGFLGANGVGKTTTLKCLFNLIKPTSGSYSFFEQGPLTTSTRQKIGFLPERPYFYEFLTGQEFLKFYGTFNWSSKLGNLNKAIDRVLKQVNLEYARKTQLKSYSKGMLQRIGFAQAIIHKPELIILDEPMAGLDPDGRAIIRNLIKDVAQTKTVFFSSHLLHDVENLCENLVILNKGTVAYQGSMHNLLKDLESGYEIQIKPAKKDNKIETPTADCQETLHDILQSQLKNKADILSVSSKKVSLEDAFLKLFLRNEK